MILFEDGDWRLVDGVRKTTSISIIIHRCWAPARGEDGWWFYVKNGVCNSCLTKAPDKLIGFLSLVNWER